MSGLLNLALAGFGIDAGTVEKGLAQAQQLGAVFAQLAATVERLEQKMDAVGLHLGVQLPVSPEALQLAASKSAEAVARLEHDAAAAVAKVGHVPPTSAGAAIGARVVSSVELAASAVHP